MKISKKIKSIIKKQALKESPNECCGLIYDTGKKIDIYTCKNLSDNPTEHFYISKFEKDKVQKLGKVIAVYHSHTNDLLEFSDEDKAIAEYFKVNYLLYCTKNNNFYCYEPVGVDLPYLYRPYITKILGQVQLIGDYYQKELNLKLDYQNENDIEKFIYKNNFVKVQDLQIHDMLLVKWSDSKLYGFIYMGNNKLLTQLHRQIPTTRFYSAGIKQNTLGIYRYANG